MNNLPRPAADGDFLRPLSVRLRPRVTRSIYAAALLVSLVACVALLRLSLFDLGTTAILAAVVALLPLAAAAMLIGHLEDDLSRRLTRCSLGQECRCGYDLHGREDYTEPRCPECGRELER